MPETARKPPKKTLYLIDGHAQFFRAYHAIRSGMTSPVTKEPTNLTFGFVGMLLKVMREYRPDYLAVVIDAAGDRETFRSEIYPEYKATRKPTPDDFHPQVERSLRVLEQMGIPVIAEPGVEADDAIASLVRRFQREQPDLTIRIVSKDKDLTQLLSPNVELIDVHKDTTVTAEETFGVPGVRPEHVLEILTLMGDAIDNIPGVPGVGPKTAAQLILQYGSVENLLAHLDEIKGKRRENIEAARDKLPMSRRLVALKDDIPIEFDLEDATCCPADLPYEALLATFRELAFTRYQDELKALVGRAGEATVMVGASALARATGAAAALASSPPSRESTSAAIATATEKVSRRALARQARASGGAGGLFAEIEEAQTPPAERAEYRCIRTSAELDAFVNDLSRAQEFAFDTETNGLSPIDNDLCGLAIALRPYSGVYIPTRSCEPSSHLSQQDVIARLKPILENPNIAKIGHNLKFDINVLRKCGVRLAGPLFDTMIASYVIDATRSSHSLGVLALALLNHTCIPISELIGTGKKQKPFSDVPIDQATCYAAEDADIALRLRDCMAPVIEEMGLQQLFHEVEMPLIDVLAELEWNGIRVDPIELDRQRVELEKQAALLRRQIQDQAPHPFNPDSSRQLAAALFNKPNADPPGLGLRSLRRGKTGPSTDQEVLEKLAADPEIASPIPRLIVEYRQLTKLVSTYLVALKEAISPRTGRIHASFNQTVAVTGRLSSSDPNLQNVPIRTEIGREIRRAFVAEKTQHNWLNGFVEAERSISPSLEGGGQGVGEPHDQPEDRARSDGARSTHPPAPSLKGGGDNVLITADYSQIELRLLAHLSDDQALIDAFHQGLDIHTAVAAEVFNVPADQVTSAQRNSAKMVNFGIVYGITAFGLARRLKMAGTDTTDAEAGRIIADYKARYSGIARFLDQCIAQAIDQGYVETISGRRRPIPQIHSRTPAIRALGERYAINTVVQGSAADLIKKAMIEIHGELEQARDSGIRRTHFSASAAAEEGAHRAALARTRMVLQIHDELVFESPRSDAEAARAFIVERMQHAMQLKVPLVVESAWSENWIDAK